MRLFRLPGLLLVRALVRELRGIREQQTLQTALLARLADHYAPQPPQTDRATVAAETGVSYMDAIDQAIILQYVERTRADTGREPTEEEILSYLSDEKTLDLHRRLIERDAEQARLAEERAR